MNRNFTLFFVLKFIGMAVNAQSIERSIVSSFGFSYAGSGFQTDCTIGEVITFTGESNASFLTQGFHQPVSIVALCQTPHEETIDASACNTYELNGETYTTAGSYTQILIANDGCDSIIHLNLQLNALSNDVTIDDNTLTALQDNATYAWTLCVDQTPLGTSQTFTPTQSGEYQVTITQDDCEVVSECVSFVVGVKEISNAIELSIYPNPTRDMLNLEVTGINGGFLFSVYDAIGSLLMSEQVNDSRTKLSVANLAVGPYMLVLHSNHVAISKSFVKM